MSTYSRDEPAWRAIGRTGGDLAVVAVVALAIGAFQTLLPGASNPLRVLGGLLLLFVLPGYAGIAALFPRSDPIVSRASRSVPGFFGERDEPVDEDRQRVHRAVVQGADREERVGSVVPLGDAADVCGRVHEANLPEATVREKGLGVALGVTVGGDGGTPEREASVAGEREEIIGFLGIECERLFGVDVAVGGESGSSDLGVGRVARQIDDQRCVDGSEGGIQIVEGGTVVVGSEGCGAVGIEIADAGQREFRVGETGGIRRRDRPRTDEQTVHTPTARARRKTPPATTVRGRGCGSTMGF